MTERHGNIATDVCHREGRAVTVEATTGAAAACDLFAARAADALPLLVARSDDVVLRDGA